MIWMHKKTGYLYELIILSYDKANPLPGNLYSVGKITMIGSVKPPKSIQEELADHYEFLGWL